MKQFVLAAVLILLPVMVFGAVEIWVLPGTGAVPGPGSGSAPLGDLADYQAIVTDTRDRVVAGDLVAAETRITDFETRWDDAEPTMRPKAPAAWGTVDAAADDVFTALRARNPDPAKAKEALAALSAALSDPSGGGQSGGVHSVAGIAVTDANGHPIPCESMLEELRSALAGGTVASADKARLADLQAQATERCNADDDAHADAFAAQARALVGK